MSASFLRSTVSCPRLKQVDTGRSKYEQAGRTNTNPREAKKTPRSRWFCAQTSCVRVTKWAGGWGIIPLITVHRGEAQLFHSLRKSKDRIPVVVCYKICQRASWHCAQVSPGRQADRAAQSVRRCVLAAAHCGQSSTLSRQSGQRQAVDVGFRLQTMAALVFPLLLTANRCKTIEKLDQCKVQ